MRFLYRQKEEGEVIHSFGLLILHYSRSKGDRIKTSILLDKSTTKQIVEHRMIANSNYFNHTLKQTNPYSSLFFYITFNTFVSSSHISLLNSGSFT